MLSVRTLAGQVTEGKRWGWKSFLLPIAGLGEGAFRRGPGESLDPCACTRVFSEEFEAPSVAPHTLSGARRIAHTPTNGDFGEARFMNDAPAGPFTIRVGILSITARKDSRGRWRSGLLAASDGAGVGIAIDVME